MKVETTPNLFEEFITEFESNNVQTINTNIDPILENKKNSTSPIEDLDTNEFLKIYGDDPESKPEDEKEKVEEKVVETTDPEKEEEVVEKTEEPEEIQYSYKAIVENAAELGILDFEDSEDIADDPEVLYNTIKKTIDKGINEYKNSLTSESKAFLDYLEKGGDPRALIEVEATLFDIQNADLTNESDQKELIKSYLLTQDYTPEEIEDQITAYEDGLLLEKQAQLAAKKLEKLAEKEKAYILQEQEKQAKVQQDRYINYITSVEKTIKESKEIAGLQISDSEKSEFQKYLLKVDKSGKTPYQLALEEDPIKTQIELAYLKFKNYDFKNVATKAKSEATKELKKIFKSNEKTTVGKTATQKQTDDFSAFKSMWNK